KIAQSQDRSIKSPKRLSPYDQTSYRTTKSRYNLRGNKPGKTTVDDSELPLATDEDTDAPDDAVMSDSAVFEEIIDELANTPTTKAKFSTPHNNDTYTSNSRKYIQEPRNEEDENMLNYIEDNIFDDNDIIGMTSTSQSHDTPTHPSSQLRTQFIDYHKFGTITFKEDLIKN
ncbi:hypothetical protein RhiirA5_437118, partial [Rhizophagus irregularis]